MAPYWRDGILDYERCADLIAHWDSDDWSHPRRLEEQVALLEGSGKACVGYRELLFWDTRGVDPRAENAGPGSYYETCPKGEAWLYRNPDPRWVCGASMLYRREAWKACLFDDAPHEDQRWWLKNAEKCVSCSSMWNWNHEPTMVYPFDSPIAEPRMIASIHGGNTEAYRREDMLSGGGGNWKRAGEWDGYCAGVMKL